MQFGKMSEELPEALANNFSISLNLVKSLSTYFTQNLDIFICPKFTYRMSQNYKKVLFGMHIHFGIEKAFFIQNMQISINYSLFLL